MKVPTLYNTLVKGNRDFFRISESFVLLRHSSLLFYIVHFVHFYRTQNSADKFKYSTYWSFHCWKWNRARPKHRRPTNKSIIIRRSFAHFIETHGNISPILFVPYVFFKLASITRSIRKRRMFENKFDMLISGRSGTRSTSSVIHLIVPSDGYLLFFWVFHRLKELKQNIERE